MWQAEDCLQGRYQLKEQLGDNPGRQTWLAEDIHQSPPQSVIVKLLAFNPQMQWDEFKLFEREGQVLKQLNHPRIPQYRDYFSLDRETGGGVYWFGLVQQFMPGVSLRHHLNGGKHFTQKEVNTIAQSVLEILIYLHDLNPPVLHRDIKPSNLLLGEDGEVYLVDFGAVQNRAATEGLTFTVVGTTGYAPLEQFWGKTVPASDLYALGATLIHLLTGTAPADLPQKDLRIQWRDRVSVSSQFMQWIDVLTAPDLDQRFSTASEALDALSNPKLIKLPLSTIFRPPGSNVRFKKSSDYLSIKIPRPKRSILDFIKLGGNLLLTLSSLPFVLFFGSILIGLGIAGLFIAVHNFMLFLLLMPLLLIMVWLFINTNQELGKLQEDIAYTLRYLFGYHCLSLDLNLGCFIIEHQLWGFSYQRHVRKLSDITNVKYIPFSEIKIETVKGYYSFNQQCSYSFGQDLTENERRWLIQEIQNWLNPLDTIEPNTKTHP